MEDLLIHRWLIYMIMLPNINNKPNVLLPKLNSWLAEKDLVLWVRHCGLSDYCEANRLSAMCCITDTSSWRGQCLRFGVLPPFSEERNPLITWEHKELYEKSTMINMLCKKKKMSLDNQDNKKCLFQSRGQKILRYILWIVQQSRGYLLFIEIFLYVLVHHNEAHSVEWNPLIYL